MGARQKIEKLIHLRYYAYRRFLFLPFLLLFVEFTHHTSDDFLFVLFSGVGVMILGGMIYLVDRSLGLKVNVLRWILLLFMAYISVYIFIVHGIFFLIESRNPHLGFYSWSVGILYLVWCLSMSDGIVKSFLGELMDIEDVGN